MPLNPGARLGPYEIVAPLGAGGMGEVYRARDTRLERTVAIKVLPSHLSTDEALRQRFEREAKTVSQLSHPHICALYDVGREGDADYLVLELLEGETLTDRLAKGPLPTDQLLRFGIQIADALDKAHRQGIVHRDLKPGNVMLTKSGVKLLDFGLAKMVAAPTPLSGMTALPTMAAGANLTQAGTILGTFQYMAPEQLEGKEADTRSDIFAFGAVLYEMATGKKAFAGASHASLIAAILEHEPPSVSSVQPMAPPALDRVIARCLAKDPEDRWQNAADLGSELKWIAEAGSRAGVPAPVVARRKGRERMAWAGFALATAAAVAFAYGWIERAPTPARAIRSALPMPEKLALGALAISPDGSRVVFSGFDEGGKSALWVRPLDGTVAQLLAGTENADFPFWSPDSRSIGFFADKKLKRIDASGGSAIAVSDMTSANPVGGSWGAGGDILVGQGGGPVLRVLSSGGKPEPATKLDTAIHETSHRYPFFLPDGRHFLYLALNLAGAPDDDANQTAVASLDSMTPQRIIRGYSNPVYASGHLLLVRDGDLVAQPFDLSKLQLHGDPQTLARQIGSTGAYLDFFQFGASEDGILVYAGGGVIPTRLQWVDRSSRRIGFVGDPALYASPRISPDGRRATVDVFEPNTGKSQIWIVDLERGSKARFTSGPSGNADAVWSPDGKTILFDSDRSHQADLYRRAVNGSANDEPLLEAEGQKLPVDWSADGRYVAYFDREAAGKRHVGLKALPLAGDRKAVTILPLADRKSFQGRLSPDGRWIAFAVDDTGIPEVFVASFPTPDQKWQVSTAGGTTPRWRRDGRELFYLTPDGKFMSVDITVSAGELRTGVAKTLFETVRPNQLAGDLFDVSPDGQRFLMALPVDQSSHPLDLIGNWPATLKR